MADSSTSTLTVMLMASSRSSRMLGSGTSMTKIRPTAATGMIHSAAACLRRAAGAVMVVAFAAMAA